MILVRAYYYHQDRKGGAPIHAQIIEKIPYKSGDRQRFTEEHGFDPYDWRAWRAYLKKKYHRKTLRGTIILYQAYRWGNMSSFEPQSNKKYVNLYPGINRHGNKRDLRTYGFLGHIEGLDT